mgnify:CR=1 FL=1
MKKLCRVVIIEDEETVRKVFEYLFGNKGVEYKSYENIYEKAEEIYNYRPDVIILDLMLPFTTGLEFLEIYRKLERKKKKKNHTPIIVISAKKIESAKLESLELGADDFIEKPFNPREIYARAMRFASKKTCKRK